MNTTCSLRGARSRDFKIRISLETDVYCYPTPPPAFGGRVSFTKMSNKSKEKNYILQNFKSTVRKCRRNKLLYFSVYFKHFFFFWMRWGLLGVHSGSPGGKSSRVPVPHLFLVCLLAFISCHLLSVCVQCLCVSDCMHVVCISALLGSCGWYETIQSVSPAKRQIKQTNSFGVGSSSAV